MQYRILGKTGEKVSTLGFGCMRLPLLSSDTTDIDEAQSIKLIRYAIDNGVNYIDTAYPYHSVNASVGGRSEPLVAKALKDGYRKKVQLATKLPTWLVKTRDDMDKYLNEQLERLQTNCIDFYLIHNVNYAVWDTLKRCQLIDFMKKAKESGKIKHIGFSFHDTLALFKEVVDFYDWEFCQIQYNYIDENFQAGTEGLKYAADKGLGIIIMEPLRGGTLVSSLPNQAMDEIKNASPAQTPAEMALRWIWNKPEVGLVLSGMNSMEQVIENMHTADKTLPNSLTKQDGELVAKVRDIIIEKRKVPCTSCGYCMPCPSGVSIPNCFTKYNNYYTFGVKSYGGITPEQQASACIECGACEIHCPQRIEIRKELKNVDKLLR